MSLPGFAFVTPFILSQGEKGGDFYHMSLPGFAFVSHSETGGGFNICLYLALPLSLHLSYRKVRMGLVLTYVCTWLSFCHSIHLPFILRQGEKGVVITFVSTWLCLCHSIHHMAR